MQQPLFSATEGETYPDPVCVDLTNIESIAASAPVCSYNEWDPLEEVIVGIVEGACFPPWMDMLAAPLPEGHHGFWQANAGSPFPAELVDAIRREIDGFVEILDRRGIQIRRPTAQDKRQVFGAPGWTSTGFYDAMPRDGFLVIGDEIIECPMAWRSRYFESSAYRALFKDYFRRGARWSAAPRPELSAATYCADWREPGPDGERRMTVTEYEPTFDAADFIRCGRDIFAQQSHVTNRFGIDWLQRHIGSGYRVHLLVFDDAHPMHIDATLMPLAPGKLLINPERGAGGSGNVLRLGGQGGAPACGAGRPSDVYVQRMGEHEPSHARPNLRGGRGRGSPDAGAAAGLGIRGGALPVPQLQQHRRIIPLRDARRPACGIAAILFLKGTDVRGGFGG